MRILIISENFKRGGLETQLLTYIKALNKDNTFYLAVDSFVPSTELEKFNVKVYNGFRFSYDISINRFIKDVERLEKIIKDQNIDIILLEPFYSFYHGIVCSQLCDIPVVYTYHGMRSINFPIGINDNILMEYGFSDIVSKIISVSELGLEAFKTYTRTEKVVIPNPINFDLQTHKIINNKEWAIISRIDEDKIYELKELILNIDYLDIKRIDIYGDGTHKELLSAFIKEKKLENKVSLKGFSNTLSKDLNGKYNGVFAIGRSALEAVSFGYPTIIIGYGKISGLLTKELYSELKKTNLVNQFTKKKSLNEIKEEIASVYKGTYKPVNRDEVLLDFSSKEISKLFFNELKNTNYCNLPSFKKMIKEIINLKGTPQANDNFYESKDIYDLERKYVLPYALNRELIILFNVYQRFYILNNVIVDKPSKWYNRFGK